MNYGQGLGFPSVNSCPQMQGVDFYNIHSNPPIQGFGFSSVGNTGPQNLLLKGFNPEQDVTCLRNAMKGLGTDSDIIIKIIANRTNFQRQQILQYYKSCYGRDLITDLQKELGGNFEKAAMALFYTPREYDALELRKAMKGLGCDRDALIEIIASRSNNELRQIKDIYKRLLNRDLEKDVASETSRNLKRLLVSLLQCTRSENPYPNPNQMMQDARDLYSAGEGKWGTDESVFNKIFSIRSREELLSIDNCYRQLTGRGILDAVEREFSGDTKKLLKSVVFAMLNPSEYFADRIYYSIKGLGTYDSILIRVLVSRDEVDINQIKAIYQKKYGISMLKAIHDDTSGHYRKLLLEIASH